MCPPKKYARELISPNPKKKVKIPKKLIKNRILRWEGVRLTEEDLFLRTERNFRERTGRTQGIKFKRSPPKKALPRRVRKDKKDSTGEERGSGNSRDAFFRRFLSRGASDVGVKRPGERWKKRSLTIVF